jgi:hypothetical protein
MLLQISAMASPTNMVKKATKKNISHVKYMADRGLGDLQTTTQPQTITSIYISTGMRLDFMVRLPAGPPVFYRAIEINALKTIPIIAITLTVELTRPKRNSEDVPVMTDMTENETYVHCFAGTYFSPGSLLGIARLTPKFYKDSAKP